MVDSTDDILKKRPATHGEYTENSRATWAIMRAMQAERGWPTLNDMARHSLYMIAHKMARIVTGNPDTEDHWDDIAGYAKLVADRIRNPVEAYDTENDIYAIIGLGLNCDRDTAIAWVREQQQAKAATDTQGRAVGAGLGTAKPMPSVTKMPASSLLRGNAANDRSNTPEDGGQHASFSEEELAREIEREI